jgi:hypothetical protein
VFERREGLWSAEAYLKASNPDAEDRFGESVAISVDTIVVGATGEDSGGGRTDNSLIDSGAAYVFERREGSWTGPAYLKAPNAGAGDHFGGSVAAFGDGVIVGAQHESSADGSTPDDDSAPDSGAAYLFVRSGTIWNAEAYLKAPNHEDGDRFGSSVAISGEAMLVGATGEDSSARTVDGDQYNNGALVSGAAYVIR